MMLQRAEQDLVWVEAALHPVRLLGQVGAEERLVRLWRRPRAGPGALQCNSRSTIPLWRAWVV